MHSTLRLSSLSRCKCCGYSVHYSCLTRLIPPRDDLQCDRICRGCVRDLELEVLKQRGSASHASSQSEDLTAWLGDKTHQIPLQLLTPSQFSRMIAAETSNGAAAETSNGAAAETSNGADTGNVSEGSTTTGELLEFQAGHFPSNLHSHKCFCCFQTMILMA